MANSKVEAVSTAIRNKALELNEPLYIRFADIFANVAIDAANEWDRDHPRVLKPNERLASEVAEGLMKEFVKTEGMFTKHLYPKPEVLNKKLSMLENQLREVSSAYGDLTDQLRRLMSDDRYALATRLATLEDWKRKVCGQDK